MVVDEDSPPTKIFLVFVTIWRQANNKLGSVTKTGYLFIYLFIEPNRVTSGLFTKSNLAEVENNTKRAHYI